MFSALGHDLLKILFKKILCQGACSKNESYLQGWGAGAGISWLLGAGAGAD